MPQQNEGDLPQDTWADLGRIPSFQTDDGFQIDDYIHAPDRDSRWSRIKADVASSTDLFGPAAALSGYEAVLSGLEGEGLRIAIIDTGIDLQHPAFHRDTECPIRDPDTPDRAPYANAIRLARSVRNGRLLKDPETAQDGHGHGTHLAGIVAARPLVTVPFCGVAPRAELMIYKVADEVGIGRLSDVAIALEDTLEEKAEVVCLAIQGIEHSDRLFVAIHRLLADRRMVVCATPTFVPTSVRLPMHSGRYSEPQTFLSDLQANLENADGPFRPNYPSAYGGVITVSAQGGLGGAPIVGGIPPFQDLGASGSLLWWGDRRWSTWPNRRYRALSGNAMAAAHVAGVTVLLLEQQHMLDRRKKPRQRGWRPQFAPIEGPLRIRNNLDLYRQLRRFQAAMPVPIPAGGGGIGGLLGWQPASAPPVETALRLQPRKLDANLLVEKFAPGEIATLTVAILLPQSTPHGRWQQSFDVDIQRGPVLISIDAQGFELVSEPPGPIDLPADRDTPPLAFQLRVLEAPKHWIHILVTQAGRVVTELVINDFSAFDSEITIRGRSEFRRVEEADLVLAIRSKDGHVEAYSPAERASLYGVDLGALQYPAEHAPASLRRRLKSLYDPDADADTTARELKLIGIELTRCLPEKLVDLLRRKDIRTVMLRHEEAFEFPFELCYLDDRVDPFFVGDRVAICRWYLGVTYPPNMTEKVVQKVAVLKGKTNASDIDEAFLRELFPDRTVAFSRRADVIEQIFKTHDFDLIHFTGHCQVDEAGRGGLELVDGSFVTLLEIGQLEEERRFCDARPFVMLNACASGQPYVALTDRDSFAHRFVTSRACAFVGTLWPVAGSVANDLAQRFYARLCMGEAIGSALLSSKAELIERDAGCSETEMSNLQKLARQIAVRSYCLFANPDLRLVDIKSVLQSTRKH